MHSEKNSLWYRFLSGKYINLKDAVRNLQPNLSPILKSIAAASYRCDPNFFDPNSFKWDVYSGESVLFWLDNWSYLGILQFCFQWLYNLSKMKEVTLSDIKKFWTNASPFSTIFWKRPLRGWELDAYKRLDSLISNVLLKHGNDKLSWHDMHNIFSSQYCYQHFLLDTHTDDSWNFIWKLKIPPIIKFFLWQLNHKILPTFSFLKKRNIIHNEICKWCNQDIECVDHLFIRCTLARHAWWGLFKWLEIKPFSYSSLGLQDCLKYMNAHTSSIEGGIYASALLWTVWLARNDNIYNNSRISVNNLEFLIKHRAYIWSKAANLVPHNHESIWCLNPHQSFLIKRKKASSIFCNIGFQYLI